MGQKRKTSNVITMRKYIAILAVVFLQAMTSVAQKNNQIRYILPDDVEVFLDSCIKKSESKGTQFYFLLKKDTTYNITIGRYSKKEKKNILKWIKQSNRNVVVNEKAYPLIVDYDLKFAAIDDNIGKFGDREGNVKRASLLLHGVTVFFTADGNIIRTENW